MKSVGIRSDERGSILVTTALCMVMFISILGLAIDFGHFLFVKRNLQGAVDAAALAAALEARTCNGTAVCTAMQSAAQGALQENGIAADTVLTNCSTGAATGTTLILNNPPCAISSDPNKGKATYAEAILSAAGTDIFCFSRGLEDCDCEGAGRSSSWLRWALHLRFESHGPGIHHPCRSASSNLAAR